MNRSVTGSAHEGRRLPSGTVTLVFTDIEGSTQLLHTMGPEAYERLLEAHRRHVREITQRHGGAEVDTQGDAFFLAFADASAALAAVAEIQQAPVEGVLKVRIGIHTGSPRRSAEGYVGEDVHLAARLCAAGHGGQVLLSSATAHLAHADLVELGEHRLKDFPSPVPVFQLGSGSFPPLRTISNTNLPRPASSFIGRERELRELSAHLNDGARLVTLIGPGGTGKSRLAIETATELVTSFKAGVFWVPLAPVRESRLVLDTIGVTLGAQGNLAEHIGEREMLLVLDNLEQVTDAGPRLAELVESCPRLRLLTTSRERLRVRGELAYPIAPLTDEEAVKLFCARADLPADAEVARLCAALENLPLALELAAARTNVLSPRQILERLGRRLDVLKGGRDADPRQQTLRATIEWSHELLNAEEQQLFRRLAVFRGGCTLEAAEAVAGADLDILGSLLDKSLVRRRGERFLMLETIREFAADQLAASGEGDEQRGRHLEHYRDLADQIFEDDTETTVLSAETDNIRAAIAWAHDQGCVRDELVMASAVALHWAQIGLGAEAHERLAQAVSEYRTADALRARGLWVLGFLLMILGHEQAEQTLHDAMSVAIACGDLMWHAQALDTLANLMLDTDLDAARQLLDQSIALRRELGNELELVSSMSSRCFFLLAQGDADALETTAQHVLDLAREHDPGHEMVQTSLRQLAEACVLRKDYVEAAKRYLRALEHAREWRLGRQATSAMWGVAISRAGQGLDFDAVRIATITSRQRVAYGLPALTPDVRWRSVTEAHLDAARARLAESDLAVAKASATPFEALLDEVLSDASA